MLSRARPYLLPMLLACFGGALLAQNFLLLPRAWRLPPLALILLGIYLLWRGDEATQRDPARRIPARERRIRLPLGDALSASLVIDAAAASIQLRAASDKTPAGAAREDAALLAGEYGSEAGFRRHFQHATILLDRRSLAELAGDNWRLRLAPELPWQLEIRSWLGDLRLDCRALRLENAQCSSVFGALRFTAPARADGPLLLRNHFGDIRLHTLPDPQLPHPHPRQPFHAHPPRSAALYRARRWPVHRRQPGRKRGTGYAGAAPRPRRCLSGMSEEATMTEKAPPASSLTDGAGRDLEIRAASEADLAACCALEHGYTSRYVWQLSARDSSGSPAMRFQRLRLPRPLEVDDAPPRALLAHSLLPPGGMLVAEERRESETRILAYLTLIHERELALTRITRLVTTRTRRGEGIG